MDVSVKNAINDLVVKEMKNEVLKPQKKFFEKGKALLATPFNYYNFTLELN